MNVTFFFWVYFSFGKNILFDLLIINNKVKICELFFTGGLGNNIITSTIQPTLVTTWQSGRGIQKVH